MPPQQQPPMSNGLARGRLEQVPCPHCGRHNNLSELAEDLDTGAGSAFEPGTSFYCDHCDRRVMIVQVQPVTLVTVKQVQGVRPRSPDERPAAPVMPQRPKQGFFDRLLGKGGR